MYMMYIYIYYIWCIYIHIFILYVYMYICIIFHPQIFQLPWRGFFFASGVPSVRSLPSVPRSEDLVFEGFAKGEDYQKCGEFMYFCCDLVLIEINGMKWDEMGWNGMKWDYRWNIITSRKVNHHVHHLFQWAMAFAAILFTTRE